MEDTANESYITMGEMNEKRYHEFILKRFEGVKSTRYTDRFNTYDWESNEYKVELKSRNNSYSYYSTTMIGYNKVHEGLRDRSGKRYFFLFAFLDGLYEWELTQTNFDAIGGMDAVKTAYDTKHGTNKTNSTFNRSKRHLYIPITTLKNISSVGCVVPDELKSKSKTNRLLDSGSR